MTELQKMGAAAQKAAAVLRTAGEKKRTALNAAAAALRARQAEILAANEEDLKAAKENGMSEAMLDRLALTPASIEGMAKGVEDVSAQHDPVGRILSGGDGREINGHGERDLVGIVPTVVIVNVKRLQAVAQRTNHVRRA